MYTTLESWLVGLGLTEQTSIIALRIVFALVAIGLSLLANFLAKRFVLRLAEGVVRRTKTRWDDALVERKVLRRLTHFVPAVLLYLFVPLLFPETDLLSALIQRCITAYMIGIGAMVIVSVLEAANQIYTSYEISRNRPIKGYIQLIQIFIFTVAGILIITTVLDRSPLGILSGIGAMTAVLLLVFKDTILGFVSGIQLTANDMVRIGDWIEMPKYGADGDIIDITLQSIKVRNWDKTITTIPIYTLVSDSFKNWRGMTESGGRRIKRSISLDMRSVKFCDDTMIERLSRIELLSGYIRERSAEISEYNRIHDVDTTEPVNGRRMTNLGTFRAYVSAYLHAHPKIHQEMTFLVRQLQPGPTGLPLEIYVFSADQAWANYESIQADIIDHLLAVLPRFDLRTYQEPSGWELQEIADALRGHTGEHGRQGSTAGIDGE